MEEQVLIKQILRGNTQAFEKLVEKYQSLVFTVAYNVIRSREEAEEVAQDTFLKAYKMLGSFEGKSRFSTWLYTIAYRTAIDQSRKSKIFRTSTDELSVEFPIEDPGTLNPGESLDQQDLKNYLEIAISRLRPQDATIITLYYLNERTVKEISEITGLTVTNVKTKLFRLREELKIILHQHLNKEIHEWL